MELYELLDLNVFMGSVLVMIIVLIRLKHSYSSLQTKLFMLLCMSTVAMLFLDILTWRLNGFDFWAVYITTFIYYLVEPVPLILWLCYLDFYLNKSFKRLKQRWFYLHLFLFILALMIVSIPTNFVFSIDAGNMYRRGPGIIIILAVNAGILLFTIVLAIRQRAEIGNYIFRIIVAFGLIPIAGSILQILFYGTTVLWASVALSVVFLYLFLETQREIRDYLTGLYNRRQIDDIIQSRMADFKRRGGFSLVMIDMDGFKKINDQFGHKEGDRALIKMAKLLQNSVRNIDFVARFGGDEFMILLEEDQETRVERVIHRIREDVERENRLNERPYAFGLSCGYTIYSSTEHKSLADLQHSVDQNMYLEKRAKKQAV